MKHFIKKIIPFLLALTILASIGWYFFVYDTTLTRDLLLQQARRCEENGKTSMAVWLYNVAYWQSGNDETVAIELSEQFKSLGNFSKAESTLINAIQDGGGVDVYIALCKTYVEQDKLRDAVTMLDRVSNPQIKQQLDALRPKAPDASVVSGTYNQYMQITFTSNARTLYLSTDQDYPSIHKDLSNGTFTLSGGQTTIYAVGVGENGLVSPLAVYGYIVKDVVEEVIFTDTHVEAAIRQQLQLSNEETIYSNMLWNVEQFTFPAQAETCQDLKWLPGLKQLTMEDCTISDFTPIAGLNKLESLRIVNMMIEGSDLSFLENLTSLTELTLSGCGISTISRLSGLTNLKQLNLSNNTIRNISALSAMNQLEQLQLSGNALVNLQDIAGLVTLKELDVSYNSLFTTAHISSLVNLTKLDVSSNELTKLEGMDTLVALEHFAAAYNHLVDVDILGSCKKLRTLDVSHNTLLNIQVVSLLTALEDLDFSHNEVSRLPSFSAESALTVIRGDYNKLTSLDNLAKLGQLTYVYMDYNSDVSNINALKNCKTLREVHVYGTKVTNIKQLADAGILVHYTPAT